MMNIMHHTLHHMQPHQQLYGPIRGGSATLILLLTLHQRKLLDVLCRRQNSTGLQNYTTAQHIKVLHILP
jgi:hypothetical protein